MYRSCVVAMVRIDSIPLSHQLVQLLRSNNRQTPHSKVLMEVTSLPQVPGVIFLNGFLDA